METTALVQDNTKGGGVTPAAVNQPVTQPVVTSDGIQPEAAASPVGDLLDWATKSGFRTSEFTLIAAFGCGILLLAASHSVNGEMASALAAGAALIFAQIRTNHKADIIGELADALSRVSSPGQSSAASEQQSPSQPSGIPAS